MGSISIESKNPNNELFTLLNLLFGTPNHLYLVYKDDNGNEFIIRGGPTNNKILDPDNNLFNWGSIIVEKGVPIAQSEDRRGPSHYCGCGTLEE